MSRIRLPLLVLTVLAALVLPATSFSQGQAPIRGKKVALLVGVTDYDHASLSSLKYTENDVEELARLLNSPASSFDEVRVLTVTRGKANKADHPSAARIRAALEQTLQGRTRHDTVLIALSGHGAQLEVHDPEGVGPSKTFNYFCPSDADFLGVSYGTGYSKSLINLNSLLGDLGRSGAGTRLVLVDACRNDLKAESATRNIDVRKVTIPKGVGVLFSCGAGQRAWETSKLGKGHGVFFYHVLQGLRGDAKNSDNEIIWDMLCVYVRTQVTRKVPGLIGGGAQQTPEGISYLSGEPPILARVGLGTRTVALLAAEKLYKEGLDYYNGEGVAKDLTRSASCFRQAAEADHVDAQCWIGWMHENGLGVPRDSVESLRWYVRSAEKGNRVAQNNLGLAYDQGKGVPKSHVEAFRWYMKAASAGLARAQNNVGLAYENGRGVDVSFVEAAKWYRKAAEQDDGDAQINLGLLAERGKGIPQSDTEAIKWYSKAAEKNEANAQANLAWMYYNGRGVKKDYHKALELFRKAADQGLPRAENYVGLFYQNGYAVAKNNAEACNWYRKAALKGEMFAQNNLAAMYERGLGVAQSDIEAANWYRKAADQGHAAAQNSLGWCYQKGTGVEKDYREAAKWYLKAAEQSNEYAQVNLGLLYEHGMGVDKDLAKAVEWYRRGANLNYSVAQANLGWMYENGRGIEKDMNQAIALYRRSAVQGHDRGQYLLAMALQYTNVAEARQWMKKAADQGYEPAKKALGGKSTN